MNETTKDAIVVTVDPKYIAEQSSPQEQHFVFSYTIDIHNSTDTAVRLLKRHWLITDSNGDTREVNGIGVVGQIPLIHKGKTYRYTSAAVIPTGLGYMEGSYTMRTEDGKQFDVAIPRFRLIPPFLLH